MTHVSTCIFQGLLKNLVFRSGALVKFFFTDRTFVRPIPYLINKKKYFFYKNTLNYYALKVKTFHSDSVKNESARTKNYWGGGAKRPPAQPV